MGITEWIKTNAIAVLLLGIVIVIILVMVVQAKTSPWQTSYICTSWEAYEQKDFDNGQMCILEGCYKISDTPWLETCTCQENNLTVTKMCMEKMTVTRWTGLTNTINKGDLNGKVK